MCTCSHSIPLQGRKEFSRHRPLPLVGSNYANLNLTSSAQKLARASRLMPSIWVMTSGIQSAMRVYVSSSPEITVLGYTFFWMVVRVTKMKSCPILIVIKTVVTLVLIYDPVQNGPITQRQWPLHMKKCQQPFISPWILFIGACFCGGIVSRWRRHTHHLRPWVRLGTGPGLSDQPRSFWRSPESHTQNAADNHEKKITHMPT